MSELLAQPQELAADRALSIEARNVSKRYRLGEHLSLSNTVARIARNPFKRQPHHMFEALHDVSFEVRPGECFGLVGANGSGKSTLLYLISAVTVPTAGEIVVRGCVMPFLQVGAGFHPELTGRENVRLFGTIMGIEPEVVNDSIDRVAAFAEIEEFIDTPNKRYSDGMQARLSFAIALVFPSHIYMFDEVLAVVDDEFRERCLNAIRQLTADGRTVVFVSHNMEQVKSVCSRALWLDKGHVRAYGETHEVAEAYQHAHDHDADA
jgi:ABC-type polysaccharide/polyol phosphate transport system ATPase subunit